MRAKRMTARVVLVIVGLLVLLAGLANAETTPLRAESRNGVLVFSSDDGQFKWWLDGRVNLDGAFFVEDKNSLGDGVQIRRARLAIKTILWGDWYAESDVDFSGEAVAMKDAFVRYDNLFHRTGYVRVGNFKEPFGFEETTSSRCLIFPERSQGIDGFVPGRKMGIEAAHFAPNYRVAGGVFGPDVTVIETTDKDMTYNFTGRASWNGLRTDRSVLHLGLAGSWRQPQFASGFVRFKTRNEYHVNNYKFVDTDNIPGVERYGLAGGEVAYVNRRLRLQSEYVRATVRREAKYQDLVFGGGYVCASVFLTDDSHPYEWQDAEFGKVIPKGKYGAWEAVYRYSTVNMTDHDVFGGKSNALTVGLNWYANANLHVYADFVVVDNDEDANAKGALVGDDNFKFLELRVMAAF
jgi:phosphate-selective porin OprO and OprP